ncbi:snRNA-activating protein complex subunit 1 [Bradysia coprophila]|uniref:snRNA-activating protein complex subunit 1 n=1 Tax=Bradysia coprophila TaxID=38358 RepID=UPI00187D8C7D|nr:snRNA-activating protein complex subunit 1 [Bradysia coprophila]
MAANAVIDGFLADTELLLNRFVKLNSARFECFCTEWIRMNFQYVFCGYMCVSEMVQFIEDAFIVVKRALLNAQSYFEKIGALYLMYAMYFKQPPKQYCKFRMTMSEWMKMNQFYNEVCIFHDQASLIFWKLLQHDAFRFVEAEYEYGFERFMQKGMIDGNDDLRFRKINPMIDDTMSVMKEPSTGIVPALEILQIGYNEMKEHLNQSSSSLAPTTIATDIAKGLEEIENLFKIDRVPKAHDPDSDADNQSDDISTRRKQLKKKAYGADAAASSESPKKTKSGKYRNSITDDGDYIKIEKATQKVTKNNELTKREYRTVVKQLVVPIEDESSASSSSSKARKSRKTIKKEKD